MKKISDILPKVLARHQLSESAHSALVAEHFKKFFEQTWGKENLPSLIFVKFKNNNLIVELQGSVWVNQVFMHQEQALQYLKKVLPQVVVKKIIGKIGG